MKVALSLSVVALVAGQPVEDDSDDKVFGGIWGQPQAPPNGIQISICNVAAGARSTCCLPNGCSRFGGRPPVAFLDRVCCSEGTTCCVEDSSARQLSFACCAAGQVCEVADGLGRCADVVSPDFTATGLFDGVALDRRGRCHDGRLPLKTRYGAQWKCSVNSLVVARGNNNAGCPSETSCVKDLSPISGSGACCANDVRGCATRATCSDCVTNTNADVTDVTNVVDDLKAECAWLNEGDLYNDTPRCVFSCENFDHQSCTRWGQAQLCPTADGGVNGIIVNTGSCRRRCGDTGAGRGRVNNDANNFAAVLSEDATTCCTIFPGDRCCAPDGTLASHCLPGRGRDTVCGRIVRASYFGGWQNTWGRFPVWREGSDNNSPDGRSDEELADDDAKQWFFRPVVQRRPWTRPVDRLPSRPSSVPGTAVVCSCDDECNTWNDCCADYADHCMVAEDPI